MNIEKVEELSEMIESVTDEIDAITKRSFDLIGLNQKLTSLIDIGSVHCHCRTRDEEERFYNENEGKKDLADAANFFLENRQGIDFAYDINPERVTEIISSVDVKIRKSLKQIETILNAVKKVDGEKQGTFCLLHNLYGKLHAFSEIFKTYLDSDPRLGVIEPYFTDSNKARTFLQTIEKNPDKDRVLGLYKQKGFIRDQKFTKLLRACEDMGLINNHKAIYQKIKRTRYC